MVDLSLVLIPGAWHVPVHFGPLVRELEKHGYRCVPVALPAAATADEAAPKLLADDIATARQAVLSELDAGRDVIVVAHSYGGHVANRSLTGLDHKTRTAAGKSTYVRTVAIISGFSIPSGPSLFDALGFAKDGASPHPMHDLRNSDTLSYVAPPGPEVYFYNDLPEEEAKSWAAELRPLAWSTHKDPSEGAAYLDIPCAYLYCTNDKALPLHIQQFVVGSLKEAGVQFDIEETVDSSHSPFLSMPKRTAEFIRRVAGEKTAVDGGSAAT